MDANVWDVETVRLFTKVTMPILVTTLSLILRFLLFPLKLRKAADLIYEYVAGRVQVNYAYT